MCRSLCNLGLLLDICRVFPPCLCNFVYYFVWMQNYACIQLFLNVCDIFFSQDKIFKVEFSCLNPFVLNILGADIIRCWSSGTLGLIWPAHCTVEVCVLVAPSCPTLCDPMDCTPSCPSVHGIPRVRILEWDAISFSRGSSQPRDWPWFSCIGGWSLSSEPQYTCSGL